MKKKVKVIAAIMLITVAFFATGFKSEYNLDNEGGNGGGYTYNGHEYVDLGLPSGTLWATCNVGANAPEEYGDYFAWGETTPKSTYNWSTYKYCKGDYDQLTKYCNKSNYGHNGFTDNLITLQPADDAATANWGNGWRMPTYDQWRELYQNTTHVWAVQNGVNGRLFTAANGNSLFLPAAECRWEDVLDNEGRGGYWSSSLYTDDPIWVWDFSLSSDYGCMSHYYHRVIGLSVRAVRSSPQKNNSDNVRRNGGGNTHPTEQGEVFQIVEEMPEFPGGTSELSLFLENNLNYPSEARENNVQGRVFVNFIVEPDGHLSNVKVLRSLGSGCDEEAIRLVKSMPNWKPGRQGGAVVRVDYILPINFKLK